MTLGRVMFFDDSGGCLSRGRGLTMTRVIVTASLCAAALFPPGSVGAGPATLVITKGSLDA